LGRGNRGEGGEGTGNRELEIGGIGNRGKGKWEA